MKTFESAFETISKLSEEFEKEFQFYTSATYSEARVRQDFIDKFFDALGWDVYHHVQKNPYQQEVRIENPQKQLNSIAQKRADYAFFFHPDFKSPKFFVEAKKPARELKNADDYFQTIRYGWNAGTGISVLTDFEEFHIIDCRLEPDINQVFNAHHKKFHFTDYRDIDKFRQIYWVFSREAVSAGNIDRYIEELPKPKGGAKQVTLFGGRYQNIDDSFLNYIDGIREKLAKAFKKNDVNLTSETLTEAVQRTVDRLVFIRFLEDKLIEQTNYVSEFGNRNTPWKDFVTTCHKLDVKYNGVVFKRHLLDEWDFSDETETLFWNICQQFSHLNTPYDFNYIPIHILGSIYERFLGQIVVATAKQVRIEPKPEVRKAGGVYYTPKYVVDYIIKNTVGKLIQDKTPKEISKMKFADIACGSGSFLIGVFEYLLDYHIRYYNSHPQEAEKDKCHKKDGAYLLTIKQKQQILLNNVFGVDIDHQATEVTQLSLYLKMLEDETTATANEMQVLFHEKILPDLSRNIKCGNSLIEPDISDGQLFSFDEEKHLNPFDFNSGFPNMKAQGGFTAIVGNPPYRMMQPAETPDYILKYFRKNYTVAEFKIDLFHLFFQRAVRLLAPKGLLGYITPSSILNNVYVENLRNWLLENSKINTIALSREKVFADADVYTSVFILEKVQNQNTDENMVQTSTELEKAQDGGELTYKVVKQQRFKETNGSVWNILINEENVSIIKKVYEGSQRLDEIADINRGLITGDKKKYFAEVKATKSHVPILGGGDIFRYFVKPISQFVLFERPKSAGGCWDKEVHFAKHKLLIRQIGFRPTATIIEEPIAVTGNVFTIRAANIETEKVILGLLNSRLIEFIWRILFSDFKNSFPQVTIFSLNSIPVKMPTDDKALELFVGKVTQLLDVTNQLHNTLTSRNQEFLENKASSLQHQIDNMVYQMFGLTEEQVQLVEQYLSQLTNKIEEEQVEAN